MTQRLPDLREPPVAGQFYMVPAIQFNWCGVDALWPVMGPMHTDQKFFNFGHPHYHVDARFVSKRLANRVQYFGDISSAAQRCPLARRVGDEAVEVPTGRPPLHRMKCQTAAFPYSYGYQESVQRLRAAYGNGKIAQPIVRADGRKLCPHRKVDLTTFEADEDGIVTCPLHGLKVCVSPASRALGAPASEGEE